ncbi:hypothetical protein M3Y99_01898400 [Aphelenchoides fujianensis]|nr:hypothetical protein M3Y99_01898400 [Aphelenchoides fujianensis]
MTYKQELSAQLLGPMEMNQGLLGAVGGDGGTGGFPPGVGGWLPGIGIFGIVNSQKPQAFGQYMNFSTGFAFVHQPFLFHSAHLRT